MNSIGVMQGRLLPKYKGRYQAHPIGYWKEEFKVAQNIGLDSIEFILDYNDADINPLLNESGIKEIQAVSDETGVVVKTICADYFMEAPIHSMSKEVVESSQKMMYRLIHCADQLGITDIVVPCVDQSSLDGKKAKDNFVENMALLVKAAEEKTINLSLETDLAPKIFANLLERMNSDRVTVNYDIGNSAALGYDPIEELQAYGNKITDIHIKDRELGGGSVVLGNGSANFELFFKEILKFNYKGPFIMQAYRDDEGVEIFKQQLDWIKSYLM